jgi:hypothetical protein
MLSNQRHKFILVPAEGSYVQQCRARCTILLSTGVPVVGLLQARRERKRGFQVPGEVAEDVVGELESKYVVCRALLLFLLSCPLRRGSSSSFYRPRRERITCVPHYSATWGSVVRRAVEWAAALTVLVAIRPSWRILYPNSGSFEGRSAADGCDVFRQIRGSR